MLIESMIHLLLLCLAGQVLLYLIRLVLWLRARFAGAGRSEMLASIYLLPAIIVIWFGLLPSKPVLLWLNPTIWFCLELFLFYRGLTYFIKATHNPALSPIAWIRAWPGWGKNAKEPEAQSHGHNSIKEVALPVVTLVVSLSDSTRRLSNLYTGSETFNGALDIAALVMLLAAIGYFYWIFNKYHVTESPLGQQEKVLLFPRQTRLGALACVIFIFLLWSKAAGTEPEGALRIASAKIPKPSERELSLVLVNRSDDVRILKKIDVESRAGTQFYCFSAQFEIPVVAEYDVEFSIFEPYTEIELSDDEERQFLHNTPGRIKIALHPDGSGWCGYHWRTYVRISVVADDGKRSSTRWFKLEKNEALETNPLYR